MNLLSLEEGKSTEESYAQKMANVRLGLIPEHVAIIMDGNRRWAKLRGFPPVYGHWKGAEVLTEILRFASNLELRFLQYMLFLQKIGLDLQRK